jgi:hypothetical protein
VLSIRSNGREIARWRSTTDGRMATQEIALPSEPLAPDSFAAPLEIVADDAPGLLKVAIANVRGTPALE